jgi:hypothetical protein
MKTELFTLTLEFRGLSDEDADDTGVESPGVVGDDLEDSDDDDAVATPKGDDDEDDSMLEG